MRDVVFDALLSRPCAWLQPSDDITAIFLASRVGPPRLLQLRSLFLKVRPDGVAFIENTRVCTFLDFTRPTDSRDGASEQPDWYMGADWSLDWAQDKDLEKNTRYARHLEYIWWALRKKGATWTTAQYIFTVGVRGSAIEAAWEDQLSKLGVNNAKTCDVIRQQAIQKKLELSDSILRQFQVATHASPEWPLQAFATTSLKRPPSDLTSTENLWA